MLEYFVEHKETQFLFIISWMIYKYITKYCSPSGIWPFMWFTYCDPQIKLLVWMSLSQRILFSMYLLCIWRYHVRNVNIFKGYFFPTFAVSEKMHHSHQTSIDGKLIICSIKANETNFLEVLQNFLTKKISVEMHKMCVINWMKKISSKITKLQLFCFRNAIMYMILISKKKDINLYVCISCELQSIFIPTIRLIRCYCYVLSDSENSHVLWDFIK